MLVTSLATFVVDLVCRYGDNELRPKKEEYHAYCCDGDGGNRRLFWRLARQGRRGCHIRCSWGTSGSATHTWPHGEVTYSGRFHPRCQRHRRPTRGWNGRPYPLLCKNV